MELAPGLHVNPLFAVPGKVFVLALDQFGSDVGLSGVGGGTKALVLHASDWERIDGAKRERLLDEWTRKSAEYGIQTLQAWLARSVAPRETEA